MNGISLWYKDIDMMVSPRWCVCIVAIHQDHHTRLPPAFLSRQPAKHKNTPSQKFSKKCKWPLRDSQAPQRLGFLLWGCPVRRFYCLGALTIATCLGWGGTTTIWRSGRPAFTSFAINSMAAANMASVVHRAANSIAQIILDESLFLGLIGLICEIIAQPN